MQVQYEMGSGRDGRPRALSVTNADGSPIGDQPMGGGGGGMGGGGGGYGGGGGGYGGGGGGYGACVSAPALPRACCRLACPPACCCLPVLICLCSSCHEHITLTESVSSAGRRVVAVAWA